MVYLWYFHTKENAVQTHKVLFLSLLENQRYNALFLRFTHFFIALTVGAECVYVVHWPSFLVAHIIETDMEARKAVLREC